MSDVIIININISNINTQFKGIELFGIIITTRKQLENARVKIDINFPKEE